MDQYIVIKIGGVAGQQLTQDFYQTIKNWQSLGKKIIFVHGGGKEITAAMNKNNEIAKFVDGYRYTTATGLAVTKNVLINNVQPRLIQIFKEQGIKLVSGNYDALIKAEYLDKDKYGYVGSVKNVDSKKIAELCKIGIPIIAPIGEAVDGNSLNLNGDTMACGVASALNAESLYLLTDVPGVKSHGKWLQEIDIEEVKELIDESIITGGMVPKMKHAVEAVVAGVKQVHITAAINHAGTLVVNEVSA